jgi:iron complex transport system substrate-binding protein
VYGKTAIDFPQRIVCLDAGAAEIAGAVGANARVVAVAAGANLALEARAVVLGRLDGGSVLAQEPDLVLVSQHPAVDRPSDAMEARDDVTRALRDVQAAGVAVLSTYPRSFGDVLRAMLLIGGALGCADAARALVQDMRDEVKQIREYSSIWPDRPRLYVEVAGVPGSVSAGWVADLIDIAGGRDVLGERGRHAHGTADGAGQGDDIREHDPQIIIVASCGEPLDVDVLARRPGWSGISAIRAGEIHDVPRGDVMVPGPSLMLGLRRIHEIVQSFQSSLS